MHLSPPFLWHVAALLVVILLLVGLLGNGEGQGWDKVVPMSRRAKVYICKRELARSQRHLSAEYIAMMSTTALATCLACTVRAQGSFHQPVISTRVSSHHPLRRTRRITRAAERSGLQGSTEGRGGACEYSVQLGSVCGSL